LIWDWVIGVLTRPGDTFDRAQQEIRFGYWWILLSVFTLETVMMVFLLPPDLNVATADVVVVHIAYLLILFDVQAAFVWAAARAFAWQVPWGAAVKFTGLLWAVLLLEDMVTFYFTLAEKPLLSLWISTPFVVWYLLAAFVGLRRLSGMATGKALLLTLMAAAPWRLGLYLLSWVNLPR
jgi:hypothetical protein